MAERKRPPMQRIAALPADALATVCRPDDLPFASTDEVPDLGVILGQQRALQAIQFGLNAARQPEGGIGFFVQQVVDAERGLHVPG